MVRCSGGIEKSERGTALLPPLPRAPSFRMHPLRLLFILSSCVLLAAWDVHNVNLQDKAHTAERKLCQLMRQKAIHKKWHVIQNLRFLRGLCKLQGSETTSWCLFLAWKNPEDHFFSFSQLYFFFNLYAWWPSLEVSLKIEIQTDKKINVPKTQREDHDHWLYKLWFFWLEKYWKIRKRLKAYKNYIFFNVIKNNLSNIISCLKLVVWTLENLKW